MKKQSLLMLTLVIGLSLLLALPLYAGDRRTTIQEGSEAKAQVDVPEIYNEVLEYRQSKDKKAYGPISFTSSTTGAWAFEHLDDTIDVFDMESVDGGLGRSCVSGCIMEGEVTNVPTGALVFGVEIEACDVDAGSQISVRFLRGPSVSGFGNTEAVVATGVGYNGGCSFFSEPANLIVDNFNNAYWFHLVDGNNFGDGTSFRLARLLWQRVVSPPFQQTFFDVLPSSGIFPFVEALAAAGITGGCGGGNYCPNNPLTRGQMAVFLSAALGLHWPG